jgi:death-on-curing protein
VRLWRWIRTDLAYAVHEIQLARHGGLDGIRDQNAVESALARPQQMDIYGDPKPDAAALAAAYAYGLARNHGFSDGNKRTAWVLARVFLADNGFTLQFTAIDAIAITQAVAAGSVSEDMLANWYRERITSL